MFTDTDTMAAVELPEIETAAPTTDPARPMEIKVESPPATDRAEVNERRCLKCWEKWGCAVCSLIAFALVVTGITLVFLYGNGGGPIYFYMPGGGGGRGIGGGEEEGEV